MRSIDCAASALDRYPVRYVMSFSRPPKMLPAIFSSSRGTNGRLFSDERASASLAISLSPLTALFSHFKPF